MIKIILADDHNIVRQGIRSLLERQPDFQVLGESADGSETVQLVGMLKPDILIVDLMMEGLNGIEVTRHVMKSSPETRVVILTVYNNEKCVLEALRAGAKGYLLKDSGAEDLIHAVREAFANRFYLGPPLSERVVKAYMEKSLDSNAGSQGSLTAREREVLNLLSQGWPNAKIATDLFISRRTVEIHRSNIAKKLGLHSQSELLRYAIRNGGLPLSPPLVETGLSS